MYNPERISTEQWYKHTRKWQESNYIDAQSSVKPEIARAGEENSWEIDIYTENTVLTAGDHIAVEVNVGWTLDRGRPFVYGRQVFSESFNPGYSATPTAEFPDGVKWKFAISDMGSMNRYYIIDFVITKGIIPKNTNFKIFLADPKGSLIRCPVFAQYVPIPVAVRKSDEEFYRRLKIIPILKVQASAPALWKIAACPGNTDNEITFKMTAADNVNQNPSNTGLRPEFIKKTGVKILDIKKAEGYEGAGLWIGKAEISGKGTKYVEALNSEYGLYGRSNPYIKNFFEGLNVYFGDLHGQSSRSIGFGTEEEYFSWARDAELLDFTAPANHYGGRENVSSDLWNHTLGLCDMFYDPGSFATFYSYEWGGAPGYSHRNVYYRDIPGPIFDAHDSNYDSIEKLWKNLDSAGIKALTIPHHTKFIGRINWNEYNPLYQRLVEVCSNWGNSETGGEHSIAKGLEMGHRLGFVGGTDTHFSQPGRSAFGPFDKSGLTAVISESLDRESMWDALYNRRCYATTGEKILLSFKINGYDMGSELNIKGKRIIEGKVCTVSEIKKLEIIRNNIIWRSLPVGETNTMEFEVIDEEDIDSISLKPAFDDLTDFVFYYLKVTQDDGHQAISSPIWINL